MRKAVQVHGLRTGLVVTLLIAALCTGLGVKNEIDRRHRELVAQKQGEQNQAEAQRLVEGLLTADTTQIGNTLNSLRDFRQWADPQLHQTFADSPADSNAKLHAGLAMLVDGQAADPEVLAFLQERLLTVTPLQLGPVCELLKPHKAELLPVCWQFALDERQSGPRRFHAVCALAAFDPQNTPDAELKENNEHNWNNAGLKKFVVEQLVDVSPVYLSHYQELLRPVASKLIPRLSDIFKDPARGELAKSLATSLLADYAANDPDTLTDLILAADVTADKAVFPVLQTHTPTAVTNLEAVLDRRLKPDWKDAPLDPAWSEPSAAVRTQIEQAHGLITERFAFCQDMLLAAFLDVAESLRPHGYRPARIRPHLSLLALPGGEDGRQAG